MKRPCEMDVVEYREHRRILKAKWRDKNRAKYNAINAKYRENNRDKIKSLAKKYNSRPDIKKRKNKWFIDRKKQDQQFRAMVSLRNRIREALKRFGERPRAKSSMDWAMGCTAYTFKRKMERKFKPGMTWSNIHIDHIRPVSSFDLRLVKEQKACFHYSNCQPLFPSENRDKWNFKDRNIYQGR